MPLIMGEMFSGFLQDAAIYTVWAKDCLQTSTSMNGPLSVVSRQSIREEVLEMEGLCKAQWDIQETGYGPGSSFDRESCCLTVVVIRRSIDYWADHYYSACVRATNSPLRRGGTPQRYGPRWR